MEIPWQGLKPEILRAVVEEFVTREGTDYGSSEFSLEQKVEHVLRQLRRGQAILSFDQESESCHILPAEARKLINPEQRDSQLTD